MIKLIIKLFLFCQIFLTGSTANSQIARDRLTGTNYSQNYRQIAKRLVGDWCLKIRDSIDFSVHIEIRNDSLFCNYVNVLFNGKYLNAPMNDTDWAFSLPVCAFDTNGFVSVQNYYNSSIVHLNLKSARKKDILFWRLEENEYSQTWILPKNAVLARCKMAK